ncbi:aldo/keto reductase [Lentisalinibacter orientalis]|uniref:aldo/keto reductase n=1 Tax=Lentisalinibacter orientalis TaxID=2992241 RepID=UPI00386AF13E
MATRRQFLKYGGAAAFAATAPLPTLVAEHKQLPVRPIPRTGDSLPVIGMGNSNAFRAGDRDASWDVIRMFQRYGSRYIDCSGDSRFVVADVVGEREIGDRVFLGTYFDVDDEPAARAEAARLLATTGKPTLDLMHAYPETAVPNWRTFRRWKEAGLTRHIGVARHRREYYPAMMDLMATGTLDVLQVNYSLMEPEAEERVLPMALERGVAVIVNRPFINGEWFRLVRDRKLPSWAAEFDCDSWAQFSLKFILSHPAVTCVLTETANPRHAVDNIGAGFGALPDGKTRQRMRDLVRNFA